jgi:superfamily I DNA and/or RNA helicase
MANGEVFQLERQMEQMLEENRKSPKGAVHSGDTLRALQSRIDTLKSQQQLEASKETAEQTFSRRIEEGKKLVGDLGRLETGLGRVESRIEEGRTADIQDIIAQRRAQLGGFTDEETRIQRARAEESIARTEETQRRRLQAIQNIAGVRGATGAAQQLQVLQEGQRARTAFERDLILANRAEQQRTLGLLEQSIQAAEASEQSRRSQNIQIEQFNLQQQLQEKELERFNLAQAARERFGAISFAFGKEGIDVARESATLAAEAQRASAAAASGSSK